MSRWTWVYLGLVAFSLCGSLLTRILAVNPGIIAPAAGALTLLVGLVAVFQSSKTPVWRIVALLGFAAMVELVGVRTGFPFGRYAYTGRWWPSVPIAGIGWFPLLVPFAWALVAGSSALTVGKFFGQLNVFAKCLIAGALAALVDVPMEPVMTRSLMYWKWLEPGPLPGNVPVTNFIGWFATAAIAAAIVSVGGAKSEGSWDAPAVLAGHLLLILGLSFG